MATIFTKSFWEAAAERAVKSAAQATVLALGGGAVNVFTLDWYTLGGAFCGGALLSVITSLASSQFGDAGTPSLVKSDG